MASKHQALETPLANGGASVTSATAADSALDDDTGALSKDIQLIRLANYPRIILFVAAVYIAFQFFDAITRALLVFFGAFLLAIVLNAPVRWLEAKGVKRGVSVAGVALILLSGIGAIGFVAGPRLAGEAVSVVQEGPQRIEKLRARLLVGTREYPAVTKFLKTDNMKPDNLIKRAGSLLPRIGRYTLGLFGGLAALFFLIVVALYTLAAPKPLIRGLLSAVPPGQRAATTRAMTRIVGQLESWALATLALMVIIGIVCGLGLWAIGVPNALFFGILAGFGEGIPTIGPILSAIPPMVVALADDPGKAGKVALLFLVVQQIENNLLVPWLMGRNLNLHPVSILFFVFALGALVGVLGTLLAVPAAIITKVIFEEFYEKKRAPRLAALDAAADQIIRAGARPEKTAAIQAPADSQPKEG